jgi:hypothetical protein
MTDAIGGNPHVLLQRRAVRCDSWTTQKRTAFLDELEASCNVTRACRAAGVSRDAAYARRRRDALFAAAWSQALDHGCENLRALLVARSIGTADDELVAANAEDGERAAPAEPPMSDETRLKVLQICRAAAEGRQGRASWRGPPKVTRTAEQAFGALEEKLDRLATKARADGEG